MKKVIITYNNKEKFQKAQSKKNLLIRILKKLNGVLNICTKDLCANVLENYCYRISINEQKYFFRFTGITCEVTGQVVNLIISSNLQPLRDTSEMDKFRFDPPL